MIKTNINKTLEDLEKNVWESPSSDSTGLVIRCHTLRKKKLKDFEAGDLRVMISQSISLKYLVPMALDVLKKDLFIDSEIYEGDLLRALLKSRKDFWSKNTSLKQKVILLVKKNIKNLNDLEISNEIKEDLLNAYRSFSDQ